MKTKNKNGCIPVATTPRSITIKTIQHKHQRYPTCGDYWIDLEGNRQIRVSNMNNEKYELLVALHELVEWFLTEKKGISEFEIAKFDRSFEKNRKRGNVDEPGDDENSPYRQQHLAAEGIEKIVASMLDVHWKTYEEAVNRL